jgi:hypothetical protein
MSGDLKMSEKESIVKRPDLHINEWDDEETKYIKSLNRRIFFLEKENNLLMEKLAEPHKYNTDPNMCICAKCHNEIIIGGCEGKIVDPEFLKND